MSPNYLLRAARLAIVYLIITCVVVILTTTSITVFVAAWGAITALGVTAYMME